MSETTAIADVWDCLTEPERSIANIMTDNLALGTASISKDVADAMWEAERGDGWEIYRDQFLANWLCFQTTLPPPLDAFEVYATIAAWPFGIILCRVDDGCGPVEVRCRAAVGFP